MLDNRTVPDAQIVMGRIGERGSQHSEHAIRDFPPPTPPTPPTSKRANARSLAHDLAHRLRSSHVLQLFLVALFARLPTFGNPIIHVDEEFYFSMAREMLHGALPYVAVWDRKPIGLFLLYLPAAWAGPALGLYVYQGLALAAATGTAVVIGLLARRAGWRRGSLAAGAIYLLWLNFADGQGGQAPVFYNLLVVLAVLLGGRLDSSGSEKLHQRLRGVGAMTLVGVALQIKYTSVFEGMFVGSWLTVQEVRRGTLRSGGFYGMVLVATALLPTAMVAAFYWYANAEHAFIYANFTSILQRGSSPLWETVGNFGTVLIILAPLVGMAIVGLRTSPLTPEARHWRLLLGGWLLAALAGLALFGTWFDHYALPAMVPAACCAAGFLGHTRRGRKIVVPLLLLSALVAQGMTAMNRWDRGTPAEFRALTTAIGTRPGCLYVYTPQPMLYAATDRCTVTPYLFPDHLSRAREGGAIGTDQATELRRIFAQRPAVVVFGHYLGERAELHELVSDLLTHYGYRRTTILPLGSQRISIYVRPSYDKAS